MTPINDSKTALAPLVKLVAEHDAMQASISSDTAFLNKKKAEIAAFVATGDAKEDPIGLMDTLVSRLQVEICAPRIDQALIQLAEKETEVSEVAKGIADEIWRRLYELFCGRSEISARIAFPNVIAELWKARWAGMSSPAALAVKARQDSLKKKVDSKAPGDAIALALFCIENLQPVIDELEQVKESLGGSIPSLEEMRKTS